jgi:(2R)-ethylmalonyl-CoA mutase
VLVGVNRFTETEPSPLTEDGGILVVDPAVEAEQRAALTAWRDGARAAPCGRRWRSCAASPLPARTSWPASIAAARAGVTTGEWAQALRDAFGSYRARPASARRPRRRRRGLAELRDEVARVARRSGRTLKILVGKPGLDGHSNGAEQIAVRARDAAWRSSTRASA